MDDSPVSGSLAWIAELFVRRMNKTKQPLVGHRSVGNVNSVVSLRFAKGHVR